MKNQPVIFSFVTISSLDGLFRSFFAMLLVTEKSLKQSQPLYQGRSMGTELYDS